MIIRLLLKSCQFTRSVKHTHTFFHVYLSDAITLMSKVIHNASAKNLCPFSKLIKRNQISIQLLYFRSRVAGVHVDGSHRCCFKSYAQSIAGISQHLVFMLRVEFSAWLIKCKSYVMCTAKAKAIKICLCASIELRE